LSCITSIGRQKKAEKSEAELPTGSLISRKADLYYSDSILPKSQISGHFQPVLKEAAYCIELGHALEMPYNGRLDRGETVWCTLIDATLLSFPEVLVSKESFLL